MPGDRNNVGGILGIDPSTFDRDLAKQAGPDGLASSADSGIGFAGSASDTKVRLMKREDAERTVS